MTNAASLASEEVVVQEEFIAAAKQLSDAELRDFVKDHVENELLRLRALPMEDRESAFRALCAEWHPDRCPAIRDLATEVFQHLQQHKSDDGFLPPRQYF